MACVAGRKGWRNAGAAVVSADLSDSDRRARRPGPWGDHAAARRERLTLKGIRFLSDPTPPGQDLPDCGVAANDPAPLRWHRRCSCFTRIRPTKPRGGFDIA